MKPYILSILIIAMLVVPVSAITYSEEYYKLESRVAMYIDPIKDMRNAFSYDLDAQLATFYEIRRQIILMEKQNELLEEQNNLTRQQMNMTLVCTGRVNSMGNCLGFSWV